MTRVLVVEDSLTQAEVLRAELEDEGYEVALVHGGREALELLSSQQFDLVLSDVVMTGLDGFELCRAVKSDPSTQHVPVVLLTSLADPLDVVHGLEVGADNFIRKPYDPEQLVSRLRATLRSREGRLQSKGRWSLELSFLDRTFTITAERQQVLDLLISTFEELVVSTKEIRSREEQLAEAHAQLATQLRSAEVERARLRAVLDSVPHATIVIDSEGLITHASRSTRELLGIPLEDMLGRPPELTPLVSLDGTPVPASARPALAALRENRTVTIGSSFDVFFEQPDGKRVPVVVSGSPVLDEKGRAAGVVATMQFVESLALHDPHTGLPGTTAFASRLSSLLASPEGGVAVMLLEIDRFDLLQASLGDERAEELLARVGHQLRAEVDGLQGSRPGRRPLLAFLGGRRFGVVLSDAADPTEPLRLAESLRAAVAKEAPGEEGVRLSLSVGAAIGGTGDASDLLTAAGQALGRVRGAGGDRVELFDEAASGEAVRRLRMEVDLERAVDRGELLLHYQPQLDLATGRLVGVEALARWHHETLGPVPPDTFIGMAEKSGLVLRLGRQLLRMACVQASAWQQAGLLGVDRHVAVNLSALQVRPALVDEVLDVLDETGLPPRHLVLELTETAAMRDPETTVAVVDQLRGRGVSFALDDFGTGYSSLAYLNRLSFEQLKLDRTFVAGLDQGGPDAAIAASVVALGHALGVRVLAEGVEGEHQATRLRELGCDLAQGYHFGLPVPADELKLEP